MQTLEILSLKKNEMEALYVLQKRIQLTYPEAKLILYGSKARGDATIDSDIDVLILLDRKIDINLRYIINEIKFAIELQHDVLLSCTIENMIFWMSTLANAMPFHWSIDKEGIAL